MLTKYFFNLPALLSLTTYNVVKSNSFLAGQRITFKKHVTLMSCTLEPTIQSCDTDQRIPFLTDVT